MLKMSEIKTNRRETPAFLTKDNSEIREFFSPVRYAVNQSLGEAVVSGNSKTYWHFHKKSEEIYFILDGNGIMEFREGNITKEYRVGAEDAILIKPGAVHRIRNIEDASLRFLCICSPAYADNDTVLVV